MLVVQGERVITFLEWWTDVSSQDLYIMEQGGCEESIEMGGEGWEKVRGRVGNGGEGR